MLNWALLSSPWNWATVIIMALFGLVLLAVISPQSDDGGTSNASSSPLPDFP